VSREIARLAIETTGQIREKLIGRLWQIGLTFKNVGTQLSQRLISSNDLGRLILCFSTNKFLPCSGRTGSTSAMKWIGRRLWQALKKARQFENKQVQLIVSVRL
jgi:hypothetical protein